MQLIVDVKMATIKIQDLDKLLIGYLKDEYEILEEKISAATAPGEHYGSIILAVDLKLRSTKGDQEEKTISLIAKLLPANAMLRKVFDVYVTFKKEVLAYSEAIPALVQFQREYSIPEDKSYDKLFPKCYGARTNKDFKNNEVDDHGVLLFENLKVQGFYTEDRLKGFEAGAVRLILKELARFHATPIALKLLKPAVFDEKIRPCLVQNKGLEQVSDIAIVFHNSIMEGARDCPELLPYLDKIQKICDYCLNHPIPPSPNEPWATFCHSDFWTSNTMILKKDGRYVENKILDLQLIGYASAAKDLAFFLFTSVINTVLDECFEEFIKIYYDAFISALSDYPVDLELFSWKKFQKEFEEVSKTEIYHILVMLKPICTERGIVTNTAENFEDSDWTRKDLLGPNHRRKLRDTVLSIAKRNFI